MLIRPILAPVTRLGSDGWWPVVEGPGNLADGHRPPVGPSGADSVRALGPSVRFVGRRNHPQLMDGLSCARTSTCACPTGGHLCQMGSDRRAAARATRPGRAPVAFERSRHLDQRLELHDHPQHFTAPIGVPPAALRFYTVAYCTPYCPRPLGGARSGHAPFQRRGGRIARHPDPPDRDHVYGVQYAASIGNMACIPYCAPC